MKKVLPYACSVLLFAQTVTASSGNSFHPAVPVKYAKAPLHFCSFGKYLQYNRKKLFEGIDSANAFYRKEFDKASGNYTDYLPLTGGTLSGGLDVFGGIGVGWNTPLSVTSSGYINLKLGLLSSSPYNATDAFVGIHTTGGPGELAGDLLLIARSDVAANIIMFSGTGTPAERLRITGSGNVGIGTTGPHYPLEVAGRVEATSLLVGAQYSLNDATGVESTLQFANSYISSLIPSNGDAYIYKTTSTSGSYPFVPGVSGSLVLEPNATGDVVFATGATPTVKMVVQRDGNVGIGTTSPSEKLSIEGNISANGYIKAKKLTVTQTGWSDYVFNKDYKLRSLQQVEAFINENNHLPEIPSAKEVEEKGISLGDNQALLLKKIEELTLYVIDLQKQVTVQAKEIKRLKHK